VRGAFVACYGREPDGARLERAVDALRWHRGDVTLHGTGPLRVAVVDGGEGSPQLDAADGRALLVHGEPLRPLADLLHDGRRFAAVECTVTTISAARDPLGLSPLFCRSIDGALWFATEIPPLAALEPAAPDLAALAAQAALVPDDAATGLAGIRRVLPGFVLEGDAREVRLRRYWHPAQLFASYRGSRPDAARELRARFVRAVERAVAPGAGILLSGGIDSTAITAVAARSTREVSAVHVAFPALGDASEEEHARRIAEAAGVPLDVVAGELSLWDPADDLRTSVVPYLTPPALAADTALAHLATQGVVVALDGNDGDGVLGYGGREWGAMLFDRSFGRLAELAREHGAAHVARRVANDVVPPALRLRGLRGREQPPATYLQLTEEYFEEPLRRRMRDMDHERWRTPVGEWRWRQIRQVQPVTTARNEEHELRGARVGIELRHPFADRELVEFLISLPAAIKIEPYLGKHLLRTALADVVPAGTLERPDKPEYRDVLRRRVDPARCLDWIRESRVRLPLVDYGRLYRDADDPDSIPLGLLVFLARAHVFAASA